MNPPSPLVDPGPLALEVGTLNSLLRTELAAVAAYSQSLTCFEDEARRSTLRTILSDHEKAAGALRELVANLGGTPLGDLGTGELFAFAPPDLTRAARPDEILDALLAGEDRALIEYERVLEREQTPDECRFAIRSQLVPWCHEHIDALAGLATADGRT